MSSEVRSRPRTSAVGAARAGAAAFGLGAAVALIGAVAALTLPRGSLLFPLGLALGGGLAAHLFERSRRIGRPSKLAPVVAFAAGSVAPGLVLPFSTVSLQEEASVAWGAVSWAAGLAAAGALGAPFLGSARGPAGILRILRRGAAGALAFGIGGMAGGAAAFALFPDAGELALGGGLLAAYALAGALLGAAVGAEDARPRPAGGATTLSGPAVAMALLGLGGALVALIYATRLRIPGGYPAFRAMQALGLGTAASQAALLLAVPGLTALAGGLFALRSIRRRPALTGAPWAGLGIAAGTALAAAALWLAGPGAARFETGFARGLLERARGSEEHWNYGNVIHDAHLALGRVALREGRVEEAGRHLLAAGRTPGSPQLGSFGPDMGLAEELLARGEREVVLEYLELCRAFWELDEGRLDEWTRAVDEGRSPDFGRQARR